MKTCFSLLLLATIVSGCMSFGRPFDTAKVSNIHIGQTTRHEVVGWFGTPLQSQRMASGKTELAWLYTATEPGGLRENSCLKVVLGTNDVVEDFTFKREGKPDAVNPALATNAEVTVTTKSVYAGRSTFRDLPSRPTVTKKPEVGMTKEQIQAQYGKPKKVSQTSRGEVWQYDNRELAMIPFNIGWSLKQHLFTFDIAGKLIEFSVDDF